MKRSAKAKLEMWTRWGYCMAPRVFDTQKEAIEHAKDMRDMGYIFGFKTSPA